MQVTGLEREGCLGPRGGGEASVHLQAFQVGAIKTLAKARVSSHLEEGREVQQVPVSL